MNNIPNNIPGSILWIAPFYNRSGYGVLARATVSSLWRNGNLIKILSVDESESGIDDVDMELIKSLEKTEVVNPITLIISHVPNKIWLNFKLPEPCLRIISTTFDSSAQGNLPPEAWLEFFKEIDQIWLQSPKEKEVFISAGIEAGKIQVVNYPDPWKDNPVLPPVTPEEINQNKPFRFLSVAMYQPRRRWDTLVESYLEEFSNNENVELYLKVNYPPWHPIQGKPKQDLNEMIYKLKEKTGSNASIIIDEELGTRMGVVNLIDSCNVYVSTDTASTAPVAESRVRHRLVIMPLGLDVMSTENYIAIETEPQIKVAITEEMAMYQPHHKGSIMPQLMISNVRAALRKAYSLTPEERWIKCRGAEEPIPGQNIALPIIYNAITAGWEYKKAQQIRNLKIVWEGAQFVYHSMALINREISNRLINKGRNISLKPAEKDQFVPAGSNPLSNNLNFYNKFAQADVTVRHQWPPNLTAPENGHWIIIQPWEFGSLPEKWVEVFSTQVDQMWVPSNYVRQVYIDSGIPPERVFVIPNGIDPEKFNPSAKPYSLTTKKGFKFLFVGGTIFRKGIDILLDAYIKTFTSKDDVCLVIKDMGGNSFYKGQTAKETISEIRKNANAPEIEYIDGNLDEEQLIGLYTACNILVHPYRGEGFGMPVLEAMACGLPVIVTKGGSTDDFCMDEFSFKINSGRMYFETAMIDNMETVDKPWLLNPDKLDLINKMRFVFDNNSVLKDMGVKASDFALTNYNWNKIAEMIENRLSDTVGKEILRFAKPDPQLGFMRHISQMKKNLDGNKLDEALNHVKAAVDFYNQIEDKNTIEFPYSALMNIAANICLAKNDFEQAEKYFGEQLNLEPESSEACFGLGLSFSEREMFNEAKTMLEWAVINDANNSAALNLLESVNIKLGLNSDHFSQMLSDELQEPRDEESLEKIRNVLSEILNSIRKLCDQNLFDTALELLQANQNLFYDQTIEKGNGILSDYESLSGLVWLEKNEIENARECFEKSLLFNPESSDACFGLGKIFFVKAMYTEAKTMFEWAVKNNESNNSAIECLANTNRTLNLAPSHNSLFPEE